MPNKCQYWNCGESVRPRHFLCHDHYLDREDGLIDQCPKCGRFKDEQYELCLDCQRGRRVPVALQREAPLPPRSYKPEHSVAWEKGDKEASQFYVYILKLDNGQFYAGQTRDLRERIDEHRDNKTSSTARQHPRLQWFAIVATREEAVSMEAYLKKLIDTNPRQIRKLIIHFKDLVSELKFD